MKKKNNYNNKELKYDYFLIGFFFSYIFLSLINNEGEKPIIGSRFFINLDKCYHIHHWFIFLLIYTIIIIYYPKYKINFLSGLLVGGILNGISYNDYLNFKC